MNWLSIRSARAPAMLAFVVGALLGSSVLAQADTGDRVESYTYNQSEIVETGHKFFGSVSGGLATVVEKAFSRYGEPNGYILGEEGSGAIVAGARYGEGQLYTRNAGQHKLFWQGPSLGWDFGGNGSRVMTLVYNLPSVDAMYNRFIGVNGSAYLIGGFGMTVLQNHDTILVPVRAGVGARLGVNIGYLKFTDKATWNPF
ncbi:MAG: DUF1134 domain-containing protein [Rhodobacteraceae bacterium]|nr:DUF1134 domain-containing protein [Paracoccaceae bacterium]